MINIWFTAFIYRSNTIMQVLLLPGFDNVEPEGQSIP